MSVNHPWAWDCAWRMPLARPADLVEMWHWTWDRRDTGALTDWPTFGRRAIGGSDFHRPADGVVPRVADDLAGVCRPIDRGRARRAARRPCRDHCIARQSGRAARGRRVRHDRRRRLRARHRRRVGLARRRRRGGRLLPLNARRYRRGRVTRPYAPWVGGPFMWRLGLRPLDLADWIELGDDYVAELATKATVRQQSSRHRVRRPAGGHGRLPGGPRRARRPSRGDLAAALPPQWTGSRQRPDGRGGGRSMVRRCTRWTPPAGSCRRTSS